MSKRKWGQKAPPPPRLGATLNAAVWYDADAEKQRTTAEQMCRHAMHRAMEEYRVILGPLRWADKAPGEEGVPVPVIEDRDTALGRPLLLVCEADVVAMKPQIVLALGGFVNELDANDLARLRKATRDAHRKANPGAPALTDMECDAVINEIGPRAAMRTLQAGVAND